MAVPIVFSALLGMVLGSFLSVVAHRVPLGLSIVAPRSRCPRCETQIAARDNVPVLSYVLLRGRCRHCGERIPARYPLIELGLGAAFVASLLVFQDESWEVLLGWAFSMTLATITLTDLEHRLIPNVVLLPSAAIALVLVGLGDADQLSEHLIAAAGAAGLLFLVALVKPQGMGMGDVKLAGVMGLYLGRAVAPALLIGFAVGALYGLALIARHGAEARRRKVPFGPFLALGGIAGLFVGDEIADWYVDSFFDG
jgi:leader peptidase (prepilin peptidase)/N-methyltransferase